MAKDTDAALNTAIIDAAKQISEESGISIETEDGKATENEETEPSTDGEEPTETSDEEDEPVEIDDDLTPEAIAEAKRLYKALNSPKGAAVIAALAKEAGILGPGREAPETNKEIKAAKKAVGDLLAEKLPENMKFLAKDLGPAIEAVLEQERTENQQNFAEFQHQKIETEVVSVTEKLNRETKGEYLKLEGTIAKLADEIPIGNMNVETYLRRLYSLASSEKKTTPTKTITDRIRRNANDASTRIRSNAGVSPGEKIPQAKSITEAVNWAVGQVNKRK